MASHKLSSLCLLPITDFPPIYTAIRLEIEEFPNLYKLRSNIEDHLLLKKGLIPHFERLRLKFQQDLPGLRSEVQIKNTRTKLELLDLEIKNITQGSEIKTFRFETDHLIEQYIKSCPGSVLISFEPSVPKDPKLTRSILVEYVTIACRYYPIQAVNTIKDPTKCPKCPRCYNYLPSQLSECPDCGLNAEIRAIRKLDSNQDVSNKEYEARENFKKELLRYQGKMQNNIPNDVYTSLDTYFRNCRMLIGKEVIIQYKLLPTGHREKTSVSVMIEALQVSKNSAYYGDVYVVCQQYWGWKLPNLGILEDQIMRDYNQTQKIYNNIIHRENFMQIHFPSFANRTSNPNSRYRLFYHLRSRGHVCSEDDFKIVKMPHLQNDYRTLFQYLFAQAGLPIPVLDV